MTDYLPYTPSEYAPDAPASSAHFQRWFENWIAGFEGAAGAPRLRRGALNDMAVGDVIFCRVDPIQANNTTTWRVANQFNFVQGGAVRVTFGHRVAAAGNADARVSRIRAGVTTVLNSWTTNNTSMVTRVIDVPIIHGDIIVIEHRQGTGNSEVNAARFTNDGTLVWDTVGGRIE